VDHLLARTSRHQDAQKRYQRFLKQRDDALFHLTQFTGRELAFSREAARDAARRGLAEFGDGAAVPDRADPSFSPEEKRKIHDGCYELLLVLAETQARDPSPRPPGEHRARLLGALADLDRAAGLKPRTRAYHLRRGRYLELLDQADAARRERDQTRSLPPADAMDHFLVGEELFQRGDPAAALREFEGALRLEPENFGARYFQSICHLKLHRPAEAKACLTACLAQRPHFLWAHLLRGYAHGELGEVRDAEADFRAAERLGPDAAARYGIHLGRGVLKVGQNQFAAAAAEFQRGILLKPREYQGYVNLARAYQGLRRPDEALAQLDQAVRLETGLAALYRARARLLSERQDFDASLRDLERSIQHEPAGSRSLDLAEDHVHRGLILLNGRHFPEALEACQAALNVRPDYAVAHRWQAEALIELDRYAEAAQALDQYFLNRGEPRADVHRQRGLVREKLGRTEEALDDYTRALELAPDADTYLSRGWAYLHCDSARLAQRDFDKAIRLDKDSADALSGRGLARVHLGDYRGAVRDAAEAVRRKPDRDRIAYNAARTFARAVAKVESDPGLKRNEQVNLRGQYQGEALKFLRQTLRQTGREARQFWRDCVQQDDAFAPIRFSQEFRALEAEYRDRK
jgi:tetratricopeptide (TPR) repeat protein